MKYKEKELTLLDIEDILQLQGEVLKELNNKEFFQPDNKKDIKEFLTQGFGLGIYDKKKLIAYQLLTKPAVKKSLHQYLPKFINKNLRAFHFETTIVHPDYRGQGFQKRMKKTSLNILKKKNLADIVCNTTYPLNYPSIKSSLHTGAKIAGIQKFYGNKMRLILFTPISKDLYFSYEKETIEIDLINYSKISEMIDKDYVGHKIEGTQMILSKIKK